jgi:hypothetical protein
MRKDAESSGVAPNDDYCRAQWLVTKCSTHRQAIATESIQQQNDPAISAPQLVVAAIRCPLIELQSGKRMAAFMRGRVLPGTWK